MGYARFAAGCLAVTGIGLGVVGVAAQNATPDVLKIGIVIPMTGTSAAVGREISDATRLYVAQHGDAVAGKKIELIIRDDASVPDNAKRLAQELIVNDKVSFLGAGLTPSAMSMAPMTVSASVLPPVLFSAS